LELALFFRQKEPPTPRCGLAPPPNDTSPLANVSYYKPGTSMQDNIHLFVRPPKDVGGFYTVEDIAKNVLAYGRTLQEIAIEWHRIDSQKVRSQRLQLSLGRTWRITKKLAGTYSNISDTSSPSLRNTPPQSGHADSFGSWLRV